MLEVNDLKTMREQFEIGMRKEIAGYSSKEKLMYLTQLKTFSQDPELIQIMIRILEESVKGENENAKH